MYQKYILSLRSKSLARERKKFKTEKVSGKKNYLEIDEWSKLQLRLYLLLSHSQKKKRHETKIFSLALFLTLLFTQYKPQDPLTVEVY